MKKNFATALATLILSFSHLCACVDEHKVPSGVVASVNGEMIHLHSLQTLLDCRSASPGAKARQTLEEMRQEYLDALNVLIIHALVKQELESRGIALEQNAFNQLVGDIKNDYGNDNLEKFFNEASISEDEWLNLTRDFLAVETFKNQILKPALRVNKEEIKAYYTLHKEEFRLPETVAICFFSAESEAGLETLCANPANFSSTQASGVQCVEIALKDVPPQWQKDAKTMKPNTCAKFYLEDNLWQTVAIRGRKGGGEAKIGEVYPLIEKILIDGKIDAVFDKWLEQKIASSRILISSELNKSSGNDNMGAQTQSASQDGNKPE